MNKNKKSDVLAKKAYVEFLRGKGFTAEIAAAPADIVANKDGETWYFEIKMTTKKRGEAYFGAATITEWRQALKTPNCFRFVIAYAGAAEGEFEFKEYTPAEFMDYSTVPPFKIYFNIPNERKKKQPKNKKSALTANSMVLERLDEFYTELRKVNGMSLKRN